MAKPSLFNDADGKEPFLSAGAPSLSPHATAVGPSLQLLAARSEPDLEVSDARANAYSASGGNGHFSGFRFQIFFAMPELIPA